ncbi:MAG TPA: carboxypeptidase-like regulatory domain-containing protein [Anaeromyxobacter sp.]|nr:carboxypeptidase-like regulatory domain-containing protein [Anaeromyxobacter sp.]
MRMGPSRSCSAGLALLSSLAMSCSLATGQRGAAASNPGASEPSGQQGDAAAPNDAAPSATSQTVTEALKLLQQVAQAYTASRSKDKGATPASAPPAATAQPGSPPATGSTPVAPPAGASNPPPAAAATTPGCPDPSAPSLGLARADVEVSHLDKVARVPASVASTPRPTAPPRVAQVRGTIRAENGAPIANAVVLVAGERAATDARGAFLVSRSPTGRQGLLATARGYVDRCVTIDVPPARDVTVTLTAAARAPRMDPPPRTVSRGSP